MLNRRAGITLQGRWYCSPQCLEAALCSYFERASTSMVAPPPVHHRIPLGLVMLSKGQLTNGQLRTALEAQRAQGGQIGQRLQALGFVSERQVTAALGMQWACPVLYPVAATGSDCQGMIPSRLLSHFQMVPVHFAASSETLYIAFCDGIDYTALHALQQMLRYRTEACLIPCSTMRLALEQFTDRRRSHDLLFEGWRDSTEMGRITGGFVLKHGVQEVRTVVCGEYIWARLHSPQAIINLLFRRPLNDIESFPSRRPASQPYPETG